MENPDVLLVFYSDPFLRVKKRLGVVAVLKGAREQKLLRRVEKKNLRKGRKGNDVWRKKLKK